MTRKNSLIFALFIIPFLYSCTGNSQITVKPGQSSSPSAAQSTISSPSTEATPSPLTSATSEPSLAPVPTPTPSSTPSVVDPDNSTGIYELRSHKTGKAETYIAICDKGLSIIARESWNKFSTDINFNEENDYEGTKSLFDNNYFIINLIPNNKYDNNYDSNTQYEWKYNYKDSRMFDVRKVLSYVGSNPLDLGYDPVLLSNTFNRRDNKGNFIEVCNNFKK